jgi:glutathione S-transferase
MILEAQFEGFLPDDAVKRDLTRLEELWSYAMEQRSGDGPWLFGDYSAADVFFAPIAARIAGYKLSVGEQAAEYVAAHLNDDAFRRWRSMGEAEGYRIDQYEPKLNKKPWPGPTVFPAETVQAGRPLNETCPYSGKPVSADSLAAFDGHVLGFCNPFCRDKTVQDAEAWPETVALMKQLNIYPN